MNMLRLNYIQRLDLILILKHQHFILIDFKSYNLICQISSQAENINKVDKVHKYTKLLINDEYIVYIYDSSTPIVYYFKIG